LGVATAVPVAVANVFATLPQPVKDCELPAGELRNVADCAAESVRGLPAGSAKLFTAKLTMSGVAPPERLATAVLVSVANANNGLPGVLLVSARSKTMYPPIAPAKPIPEPPRTVVNPAA